MTVLVTAERFASLRLVGGEIRDLDAIGLASLPCGPLPAGGRAPARRGQIGDATPAARRHSLEFASLFPWHKPRPRADGDPSNLRRQS